MNKLSKIIAPALLLTSCAAAEDESEYWMETERFVMVEKYKYDKDNKFYVFMDKQTGVEYLFWKDSNGRIAITPLYNKDGTLITYGESY